MDIERVAIHIAQGLLDDGLAGSRVHRPVDMDAIRRHAKVYHRACRRDVLEVYRTSMMIYFERAALSSTEPDSV